MLGKLGAKRNLYFIFSAPPETVKRRSHLLLLLELHGGLHNKVWYGTIRRSTILIGLRLVAD